jgi:hypothetical protein
MLTPDYQTRKQIVADHQDALRRLAERPVQTDGRQRRFTWTVLAGPPPHVHAAWSRRFRRRRRAAAAA